MSKVITVVVTIFDGTLVNIGKSCVKSSLQFLAKELRSLALGSSKILEIVQTEIINNFTLIINNFIKFLLCFMY